MSANITRAQTIFIDSRYRDSGTSYNMQICFPRGTLQTKNVNEKLKISVLMFTCFFTMESVTAENNCFKIRKESTQAQTDITIPLGHWKFHELCDLITQQYPEVTVTYNRGTGKLTFQFAEPHSLIWVNKSHQVFGFAKGSTPVGSIVESTTPINLNPISNLCVHLDGISLYGAHNLDNTKGSMRASSMVLAMPMNARPYEPFIYTSQGDASTWSMANIVDDTDITELLIRITDFEGNMLYNMPEFQCVLMVETVSTSDSQSALLLQMTDQMKDLLEYTQMNFLKHHIKDAERGKPAYLNPIADMKWYPHDSPMMPDLSH